MNLRMGIVGIVFLAALSPACKAQDEVAPTLEAFVGYSRVGVRPVDTGLGNFSLNGGDVQGALRLSKWLSGVADFGVYATGHQTSNTVGIDIHGMATSYLFGPRLSYRRWSRFTPFAQALFGIAHAGPGIFATTSSQNRFAFTVGGGIDFRVKEHIAVRPIAVDYLRTRFDEQNDGMLIQNNIRYSSGVVFRF